MLLGGNISSLYSQICSGSFETQKIKFLLRFRPVGKIKGNISFKFQNLRSMQRHFFKYIFPVQMQIRITNITSFTVLQSKFLNDRQNQITSLETIWCVMTVNV